MSGIEHVEQPQRGLTIRSVVVSLLLAWAGTVWMKVDGLVSHTIQLGESVPAIPAVAGLCLLLAINPLLARINRKLALTRPEMVVVFVVLSITPIINSVGMMRMLLPATNVAYYFSTPENHLAKIWELVPNWYGPRDPELIRQMYEGSDSGAVPWGAWLQPLLVWGAFALAFFVCMLSLNTLFRKQWTERERLAFPLVQFVEPLTPDGSARFAAIIRNPLLWTGFAISFVYNLLNMLHAVNPAVPAPGKNFNLGALFTERPWSAIQPLVIYWRPAIFGLGFLMSTEITFSCWVFYLLVRCSKVVATIQGTADTIPGLPFDQELSMGGFLAIFVFVLWVGRKHLAKAFRVAFLGGDRAFDEHEPMRYRWAFCGFIASFAFMIGFAIHAGMTPWLALLYFGLVVGVSLAYARIRAETGSPMIFGFPFWQHQFAITNAFGSARLAPGDDFRSLTIMHSFAWLSRGFYTTTGASQIEAFKLSDETKTRSRDLVWALLLACLIGLGLAYWAHLTSYYEYGGNVLEGGSTEGGYRIRLMTQAYTEVATWTQTPKPPDGPRNWATFIGFLLTTGLIVLRAVFLRFPLHPLGFAMITAYGGPVWGPALMAWAAKVTVLRIGGVRLYKRLIPMAIGIILGHFFTAGVIWGMVAVFNEELAEKYAVWFG